jgi:adenylylsulfate kinase
LENIHPIFDSVLSRHDKEKLLRQKAVVLWLVGLSGSGKSTLARALEQALHERGFLTYLLDGDNLRAGLNKNLGFSEEDRLENIRRAAEAAKLLLDGGLITICSFISPTAGVRNMARTIIGKHDYLEIYVNAPLQTCEERDVKGLYAKARRGEIPNFTGISAPFEAPADPFLEVHTDQQDIETCKRRILNTLLPIVSQNR